MILQLNFLFKSFFDTFLTNHLSQTGGECAEKAVSLGEKCWNLTNTAKVNYSTVASERSCELPSRPELEILRPDAFEDILPQELSKSETFWIQNLANALGKSNYRYVLVNIWGIGVRDIFLIFDC